MTPAPPALASATVPQARALHGRVGSASKTKLRTRLLPASSAKGEFAKAMRYLCRRLSAAVCWQVADDACGRHEMSPGGHLGPSLHLERPTSPDTCSWISHFPEVATRRHGHHSHGLRSRHTIAARLGCQHGAAHRTNDIDTDQRRASFPRRAMASKTSS
jgi:hypothetical protein